MLNENEVLDFIKDSKSEMRTTKEINKYFQGKGYTQGQVSGVINRLKNKGLTTQVKRGEYSTQNSSNLLDTLKWNIKQIIKKQNSNVKVTDIISMNNEEQIEYSNILKKLTDLSK